MMDEFVEIDCGCGAILSIYEVKLTIDPSHPSYRFVQDKEAVKDAVWYHATLNDNWLSPQDPSFNNSRARPQYRDGSFKAHVGSRQAAVDRALSQLVTHSDSNPSEDDGFWLYEVKIAQDADVIGGLPPTITAMTMTSLTPMWSVTRIVSRILPPSPSPCARVSWR